MDYVKLQGAERDDTVMMSDEKETEVLKYHDINKVLI
jgi:hypothetical protein